MDEWSLEVGRHRAFFDHLKQTISYAADFDDAQSTASHNSHSQSNQSSLVRSSEVHACVRSVCSELLGDQQVQPQVADGAREGHEKVDASAPGALTGVLVIYGPAGSGKTAFAVFPLALLLSPRIAFIHFLLFPVERNSSH